MTLMDGFSELASGSLPVLTGADPMQPSWSRSLPELQAANEALLGGQSQPQSSAAHALLGDRTDFGRLAKSLEEPKASKLETFVSVEDMLRQHRDGIMERILQREREQTRRKSQELVEKQLQEDWQKEREWWLKEIVGTRTLGGSSSSLVLRKPDGRTGASLQALPGPLSYRGSASDTSSLAKLDTRSVQAHLEAVKSINNIGSLSELISKFQKIPVSGSAHGSVYTTAWQLLSSMLPNLSSPIHGASGALVHFCKQFQNVVINRVRAASLAGQDVSAPQSYGTGLVSTVATYVKLEFGDRRSIWHVLYFCLRCGDAAGAQAALGVAASSLETPIEAPIRQVISDLSQRQGNASCLWEVGPPMISSHDRQAIADLYERANSSLEPENIYRLGTLALLSGIRSLPSSEAGGFSTIEDYLFGCLWQAVQHQNPMGEIIKLGEVIRGFGPDHFGDEETGGWSYALPLLATQQFKTALSFLADAGGVTGLMQATHLGLALSLGGVAVEDAGRDASSESIVAALLVAYASKLQAEPSAGVMASLEYLLRIPSKDRARKEIASLVVKSQGTETLAGTLSEDGVRQNGALDKFLPHEEVSLVLAEAAETLRKDVHDKSKVEASARLFMLAGRYSSVVMLLNELMAPPDNRDEIRRYWCNQSQMFYATYLAKRTIILETLERENKLNLVVTNRMLTDLRLFFEKVGSGEIEAAWEVIIRLDLLPLYKSDLSTKASKYQGIDQIVKTAYPALLRGAMECLYNQHRRVKSESHGITPTVQARLNELQDMAKLLHTFAGLANVPSDMKDSMSRLEAHMT